MAREEARARVIEDAETLTNLKIDASGRALVSQPPPEAPPGTTAISQTEFGSLSGTDDSFYTITNGTTLTITRLLGGAEGNTNGGTSIELYEAPNGNTTGIGLIAVIFSNGQSTFLDLNREFVGNGTRAILLRRRRLDGGSSEVYGAWEGFES